MKTLRIAGIACLVQIFVCAPGASKEEIATRKVDGVLAYFEPKSSNGEPIRRPAGCGNDGTRIDSFQRDLGEGVSVTVIPTYGDTKLLVNLIFRYNEKGGLKISPENFELHALPNDEIFTPTKLHRGAPSTNSEDAFLEEVYLEFSIPPDSAKHIAIVFPEGTVSARGVLKVGPVLFDDVGQSADGRRPKATPCMYSTEPPTGLSISQLKVVPTPPPVKTLKAEELRGTWIADAAATERNLMATTSLSEEEFGWIAGTAGMMFGLVYEIGDGTIKVRLYDTEARATYRLIAEQKGKGKLVYKAESPQDSGDDLLTVAATEGGNIKLTSQNPGTGYVEFKRVKLDPKNKERDKEAASDAIQALFAKLQKASKMGR